MSSVTVARDPAFDGEVKLPEPTDESQINQTQGRWPRMLHLREETEDRLAQYLEHEIRLCWQERSLLVDDWIAWQKDYWAKPEQKVKNFPFRRSANIVIPMTAIAVEAVLARIITTIFSVKPFYSLRPRIPPWVEAAPEVEGWFQTEVEDPNALNLDGFARESLLEYIKFGTGVGKSGYERDLRKVNIDNPDGTSTPRWVEVKNGATLDYVPLANFCMRLHERDPQSATWVGEEHGNLTWSQLKRNVLTGRMKAEAVEKIKHWYGNQQGSTDSSGTKYQQARYAMEGDEPAWREVFSFVEVWLSFDVDGDGVDEEIVAEFHVESRTFLSIRYNWYKDLHRPYRIGVYIPVEGRWAGVGIGKQLEQFQALITAVHRQRLDAGTLANMGQLALKKGAGYGADEPIWPGKIWLVNDVNDIAPFQLSNTQHFAQISNEDNARQYADKRSGVNEMVLGFPTQGTPGTATSDLAKLAEGNKKFDMVLKNVRRWYSLLGSDVLANYQQFGDRERSWLVRGEGGKWVEHFLSMPQDEIRRGVFLELTVTDSITNRDVEQQKWMSLFSVLTAYYDKSIERAGQIAGLMQDPTIFLMFSDMALRASNEATKRLMQAFQVIDVDNFLLDLDQFMQKHGGPPGAQPGEVGGAAPGPPQIGAGSVVPPGGVGLGEDSGAIGVGADAGGGISIDEG